MYLSCSVLCYLSWKNSAPLGMYMCVPQACKHAIMACNNSMQIYQMLCVSRKPWCFWIMNQRLDSKWVSNWMSISINQSIYVMSWGATGTQQTRSSVQWIHTDKICFLHAEHSLRKPPHAFGSHKVIKSAIVQQCCRRSKCCDLMWLYAGQKQSAARPPHNPMTCTLDTACLSYLGEHRLPSGLCLPADHGIQS